MDNGGYQEDQDREEEEDKVGDEGKKEAGGYQEDHPPSGILPTISNEDDQLAGLNCPLEVIPLEDCPPQQRLVDEDKDMEPLKEERSKARFPNFLFRKFEKIREI